jgi:hypothetical protein
VSPDRRPPREELELPEGDGYGYRIGAVPSIANLALGAESEQREFSEIAFPCSERSLPSSEDAAVSRLVW